MIIGGELAVKKAVLQRSIFKYEKQRGNRRILWGEDDEKYKKYSYKISMKIHNSKKSIKRLEAKLREIIQLEGAVIQFLGFSPKESPYTKNGQIARRFFYRWGMENGINGAYLRKYIGQKGALAPSRARKALIRSTSYEERDMWNRFKSFMKNKDYEEVDTVGEDQKAKSIWGMVKEFIAAKTRADKKLALYIFYRWARINKMDASSIKRITGQYSKTIKQAEEEYHDYFNHNYNGSKFDRRKKWEEFNQLVKESSNQFG